MGGGEEGGRAGSGLKFLWNKELIFFFELISVVKFKTEPACVVKVGFVDDESGVFDLG